MKILSWCFNLPLPTRDLRSFLCELTVYLWLLFPVTCLYLCRLKGLWIWGILTTGGQYFSQSITYLFTLFMATLVAYNCNKNCEYFLSWQEWEPQNYSYFLQFSSLPPSSFVFHLLHSILSNLFKQNHLST